MKKTLNYFVFMFSVVLLFTACEFTPNSDDIQRRQQEVILKEGTASIGMPAIKNFREKRILKDIIERRDQDGLVTYTYVYSEMQGKYTYIGQSIGYGISAATQFTNPQKSEYSTLALPQADPNGLFSPTSAEGTWIMIYDPAAKEALPQYIESRISVFTYKIPARLVIGGYKD
jgi:hypothetical protein